MSSDLVGPEGSVPPPPPVSTTKPVAAPKSPGLALVLSVLFPGIGQVYNGQPAKALVFFCAFVGGIYATTEISPLPFAFLIPFVFFYSLVDAYRSASLINARAAGGGTIAEEDGAESPAWGATLIGMGLLFLANNLEWLDLARIQRYWPLVLIVAGVALLYGSLQKRKDSGHGSRF